MVQPPWNFRKILKVYPEKEYTFQCVSTAPSKGRPCSYPASGAREAGRILDKMDAQKTLSDSRGYLESLAYVSLCRHHCNGLEESGLSYSQVDVTVQKWERKIEQEMRRVVDGQIEAATRRLDAVREAMRIRDVQRELEGQRQIKAKRKLEIQRELEAERKLEIQQEHEAERRRKYEARMEVDVDLDLASSTENLIARTASMKKVVPHLVRFPRCFASIIANFHGHLQRCQGNTRPIQLRKATQ